MTRAAPPAAADPFPALLPSLFSTNTHVSAPLTTRLLKQVVASLGHRSHSKSKAAPAGIE
jgi:hypothetical protein